MSLFGSEKKKDLDKLSAKDLDKLLSEIMDKMRPVIKAILSAEISAISQTPTETKPETENVEPDKIPDIQSEKPAEECKDADKKTEESNNVIQRLNEIETLLRKFIDSKTAEPKTPAPPDVKTPAAEENDAKQEITNDVLKQKLDAMDERLQQFEYKDKIIKELHDELQKYRTGLRKEFITPLLKHIIREYNRADKQYKFYLQHSKQSQQSNLFDKLLNEFQIQSYALLELLNDYGIETYEAKAGDPFSGKIHKIADIIPTEDSQKNDTVAECVTCGFRDEEANCLLQAAEVKIFKKQS